MLEEMGSRGMKKIRQMVKMGIKERSLQKLSVAGQIRDARMQTRHSQGQAGKADAQSRPL